MNDRGIVGIKSDYVFSLFRLNQIQKAFLVWRKLSSNDYNERGLQSASNGGFCTRSAAQSRGFFQFSMKWVEYSFLNWHHHYYRPTKCIVRGRICFQIKLRIRKCSGVFRQCDIRVPSAQLLENWIWLFRFRSTTRDILTPWLYNSAPQLPETQSKAFLLNDESRCIDFHRIKDKKMRNEITQNIKENEFIYSYTLEETHQWCAYLWFMTDCLVTIDLIEIMHRFVVCIMHALVECRMKRTPINNTLRVG